MSELPHPTSTSNTESLKRTAEDAKARASQEGSALKEQALDGLDDAKSEAADQGEAVKNRAASEMSQTAKALRAAADELDDGSVQHQIFTQASDAVGGMSKALTDRSLGEIVEDLTRFGRRNPAALIGGAVLAGLVVSRFMRASDTSDAPRAPGVPATTADDPPAPFAPPVTTRAEPADLLTGKGPSHG